MSWTAILRGVYGLDGSALVIVGQPAVLLLQLTQPDPPGPDVPQNLTGRAFVQNIVNGEGDILAAAAGAPQTDGEVMFTLAASTIAGLLTGGASAIDLTHTVSEIIDGGDDLIFSAAFSVRTAQAGAPRARFIVDTSAPRPLVVRYVGAPGQPGAPGDSGGAATTITYEDGTEPPLGATNAQAAIAAVAARLNLGLNDAALDLQPSWATASRWLAAGTTHLVLSEVVSSAGVFTLWRGGVVQAPSGYTVNDEGSATITIPVVGDDGSGGESFEWIHTGVDPLRVLAAREALGL